MVNAGLKMEMQYQMKLKSVRSTNMSKFESIFSLNKENNQIVNVLESPVYLKKNIFNRQTFHVILFTTIKALHVFTIGNKSVKQQGRLL